MMNTHRAEIARVYLPATLVFLASVVGTVAWCGSMGAMHCAGMPWMIMPGQTWFGATAEFTGMWSLMMIAMMMPVLAPELVRRQRDQGGMSAWKFGAAYFAVWTLPGLTLFPIGVAFADLYSPVMGALVVMIAGGLQFTRWKSRQLACCRTGSSKGDAWRAGARLGVRCVYCCAGLTAALVAIGVMDLRAMALVTIAISAERLASSRRVAHMIGAALILTGVALLSRTMSFT